MLWCDYKRNSCLSTRATDIDSTHPQSNLALISVPRYGTVPLEIVTERQIPPQRTTTLEDAFPLYLRLRVIVTRGDIYHMGNQLVERREDLDNEYMHPRFSRAFESWSLGVWLGVHLDPSLHGQTASLFAIIMEHVT